LKRVKGLKTGYTRKVFHVLIFLSAVVIQMIWGLQLVCLFGVAVSVVIGYAIMRGEGHQLYEAIAREQDAPRRTYYIIAPYFATLFGGIASNILFGPFSVIGYLVGGIGDAAGEPIGTRWGRHRYRAPSFGRVQVTRSLEGSAGVFVVSLLAIAAGVAVCPQLHFTFRTVAMLPVLATVCALLEAVSPHGWDNTVMQIVPAFMAYALL
jgi:phytol kinase